jgi:hypothetical protein
MHKLSEKWRVYVDPVFNVPSPSPGDAVEYAQLWPQMDGVGILERYEEGTFGQAEIVSTLAVIRRVDGLAVKIETHYVHKVSTLDLLARL